MFQFKIKKPQLYYLADNTQTYYSTLMKYIIPLFTAFLCCFQLQAQSLSQTQPTLTVDQIMQGEDFVGYLPERIRWSDDSQYIYFSWNPEGDTIRSTYKVNITSKEVSKLSVDELKAMTSSGEYTKNSSHKVYDANGDLFLQDMSNYAVQQITNTNQYEYNPFFSKDEKSIIYQMGDNLFSWNIETGAVAQMTDFKEGSERSSSQSEQDEWLEEDQLEWFQILKERKETRDTRRYRRGLTSPERPATIYTGSKRLRGVSLSSDERYVMYNLIKSAKQKNTKVPDYVTQSGYTTDLNARSKVGAPQSTSESWIWDRERDTTYMINTDDIEGIKDKPAFMKEYAKEGEEYSDQYKKARPVRVGTPVFSEDGKAVVNITSQDYKDRWVMLLDLETGDLKQIDRQHDDAWIGGPGVGWFSSGVIGWLDNETIWFKSEKTGYAHLYKANVNSGKIEALTQGEFEILDVELSKDKKTFFLTSNKVSPHEQHFYHLPAKGGKMKQVTSMKGGHQVTISPDEKTLAVRYAFSNKPWELYMMPNKAGAEMEQLTSSTTDAFNTYSWREKEIIRFKASDGVEVPATLYKPAEDKKNGAAVIFVHGAGYLQNVHHWWASYYREYMFHNFLADNGYTVLAIDFRASAGYGRDWRTAIYRHMGGKDLDDQVDGAKYLVEQHGIDADRIGIYGGSYGGFITLMAMFKYPDTFKSGAALRSVTDWAHYNHGYTANILNTPVQDSIAYARSSPLYFAEGLKGNLLILHGMIDRNVHFQDVVRLSQRLIELKKENWEMAVFPLEGHGFVEASSWSDEYRRIYKLFDETLRE